MQYEEERISQLECLNTGADWSERLRRCSELDCTQSSPLAPPKPALGRMLEQKTSGGPFQPNDPKALESDYSNHYYCLQIPVFFGIRVRLVYKMKLEAKWS